MKLDGIVRGVIEMDNSQQMDHKKWYTCMCTSEQTSVCAIAVCFSMKLDGIVRGMMDGGMSVNSLCSTHHFSEP